MNDSLLIYILSHKDLCEISSRAVWECLNLEPFIFINLSRLDIGKYQSNTFSESRFFINRSIPSDDYVGIITANYEDKYRGLWPLKWPRFLPKEPRVVWTPSLAAPDWRDITEHRHPGMMDIILSMSKDLDIAPPVKGQSIWSNNFICSRDVYRLSRLLQTML